MMYWVKNDDGNYEMLDGQQRTISICQYVKDEFSINHRGFSNLTNTEKEQILNYKLMICLKLSILPVLNSDIRFSATSERLKFD